MDKDECISEFMVTVREKQRKDIKVKDREEKKVMKENIMKNSDWLKKLESVINAIAREIDFGLLCISCGGNGKPQAGHYHSVGSNFTLRFNLHNIHVQDYRCNVQLSANIIGYDEGLITIYGNDYWNYIKFELKNTYHNPLHLTVQDIKEYILISNESLKILKNNQFERSPKERIILRSQLNKTIGIYKQNC